MKCERCNKNYTKSQGKFYCEECYNVLLSAVYKMGVRDTLVYLKGVFDQMGEKELIKVLKARTGETNENGHNNDM